MILVVAITALVLSVYSLWVSWQNKGAIKAIMRIIEEYEKMIIEVLKK